MDNTKYAYIVGRLRALETKMMNQSLLERLIDAGNASEAYRVLNDMPLIMGNINDYEVKDFNKVLIDALREMKNLFIQMAPYPEVLNFIWYKYDFHNLKVVLKAKLGGHGFSDVQHALIDLGNISFQQWEKYLFEGASIKLTKGLDKAIDKARELYEKSEDPQVIDQVIDNYYLTVLRDIANNMQSELLLKYLRRIIDFSNLRAFIRTSELKKDRQYFESVLLDGGHVSFDTFITSFERGYEDLRQALEKRMHADDLVISLEHFIEHGSLFLAEKKAYELQQKFMNDTKKIVFGPEPVFAFFWRFENQLQIIRTVLVSKLNKLPAEEIYKHVLSL